MLDRLQARPSAPRLRHARTETRLRGWGEKPGSKSPRWPRRWSDPHRGASNLAGRSKCVNQEATKVIARAKRIAGALGVPSRSTLGEGHVDIAALERSMIGLPGVVEDGMPGANEQRKPGTARGSPRRSRTAKASRISRRAVKSRCACEWVGWGRLSDDGPGHYNPNPSEDPWGGGVITLQGGAQSSRRPDI